MEKGSIGVVCVQREGLLIYTRHRGDSFTYLAAAPELSASSELHPVSTKAVCWFLWSLSWNRVGSEQCALQACYWRCLKPFVELWGFDPYATPFTAEDAMLMQPVSPSRGHPKYELTTSPTARQHSDSQLFLHKSGHSLTAGSLEVSKALQRSKLAGQRQQVWC